MTLYDGDTFEHAGRTFRFNVERDDNADAPWDRECGHGPVSHWTTCEKRPGEWIVSRDSSHYRYYDAQEATRIAKAEGWGLGPDDLAKLTAKLGRTPTRNEVVAESVRLDFEHMRSWAEDRWEYVGVIVTHIPDDSEEEEIENDYGHALWGIESFSRDYLEEVAHELASEIVSDLETETREAAHWAAMDVATIG